MARAAARPPGRRRRRRRSDIYDDERYPRRQLLPPINLLDHRLPIMGVGLVLITAALTNWLTSHLNILSGLRATVVEAVGVGVYLALAVFVIVGFWRPSAVGPLLVKK